MSWLQCSRLPTGAPHMITIIRCIIPVLCLQAPPFFIFAHYRGKQAHTMKESNGRCTTLSDVQLGNGSWPSCIRAYACCSAEAAPGDHLLHRQELYLHNSRIGQIQEDWRQIKLFRRPHNICSARGLCCCSEKLQPSDCCGCTWPR